MQVANITKLLCPWQTKQISQDSICGLSSDPHAHNMVDEICLKEHFALYSHWYNVPFCKAHHLYVMQHTYAETTSTTPPIVHGSKKNEGMAHLHRCSSALHDIRVKAASATCITRVTKRHCLHAVNRQPNCI